MGMGTYTLDGVPLDDAAGRWRVSDRTLLTPLPAPVVTAARIPGVHGTIPTPASVRDAGAVTIGLLVTDNDAGGDPTGDHQQMRDNVGLLYALATPIGRLPVLRYVPDPDVPGTYREASVRLTAAVEPEMSDPYTADLTLPFEVPGTFWRGSIVYTISSGAVTAWTIRPSELDGTTGTITDPVILCAGPLGQVAVTDAATGRVITWTGTVAAGQWLRIEPATLAAYTTTGESLAGGTDVSGGLSTGPGGFDLNPSADRRIGWTLTRNTAGTNRIKARRSFL